MSRFFVYARKMDVYSGLMYECKFISVQVFPQAEYDLDVMV